MSKPVAQIGVGLRHEHLSHVANYSPENISWFEVHTENYLDNQGHQKEQLIEISKEYPISLHGVGMSIASAVDLNREYIYKVKELADEINAFRLSDHLSWSANNKVNFHTLLPISYDHDTLNYISDKLSFLQDYFKRPVSLENISYYFKFNNSTMEETEFINKLFNNSRTKLLLDINNVYVNSLNFDFDPREFINNIDENIISEIHLAGYSNLGSFIYDTHSKPVYDEVWNLLKYTLERKKLSHVPILIEWDNNVPEFDVLEIEANKAKKIWEEVYHV